MCDLRHCHHSNRVLWLRHDDLHRSCKNDSCTLPSDQIWWHHPSSLYLRRLLLWLMPTVKSSRYERTSKLLLLVYRIILIAFVLVQEVDHGVILTDLFYLALKQTYRVWQYVSHMSLRHFYSTFAKPIKWANIMKVKQSAHRIKRAYGSVLSSLLWVEFALFLLFFPKFWSSTSVAHLCDSAWSIIIDLSQNVSRAQSIGLRRTAMMLSNIWMEGDASSLLDSQRYIISNSHDRLPSSLSILESSFTKFCD